MVHDLQDTEKNYNIVHTIQASQNYSTTYVQNVQERNQGF